MSHDIRIKKGLDIKLKGEAEKSTEQAIISNYCTIRPEDFHSVIPKLVAKEGTKVKAGETVFYDKSNEAVKFVSSVLPPIMLSSNGLVPSHFGNAESSSSSSDSPSAASPFGSSFDASTSVSVAPATPSGATTGGAALASGPALSPRR